MGKPIKDMFLDIIETWEQEWRDTVGLYEFLDDYIEIDDGLRTYVIKKRKKSPL